MAKTPRWLKIETVGTTEKGNLGVRLTLRWWAVPFLWLVAVWRLFTGQLYDVPDSSDGIEIVDMRMG